MLYPSYESITYWNYDKAESICKLLNSNPGNTWIYQVTQDFDNLDKFCIRVFEVLDGGFEYYLGTL